MRHVRAIVLCIIYFVLFQETVYAQEVGTLYYYQQTKQGNFIEATQEVQFYGPFTVEQKAYVLLDSLFSNQAQWLSFVPEGTEVEDVFYFDGTLEVYLNESAFYCGGRANQERFSKQILNTVYSLEEIRCIILYVDGEESGLSEGFDYPSMIRETVV